MTPDSVHEDIGYQRDVDMAASRRMARRPEMKRIRYIGGLMKDVVTTIKVVIADTLIERGLAVEVDREPGQEG